MKKMDNKGFMLAEIIVVSAVLATCLVGLFATFSKVFLEYEKRNNYESIDAIYASRAIAYNYKSLITFNEEDSNGYKYIENNDIFNKYKVVNSYIVKYDSASINKLLSNEFLTKGYEEYLKYLDNNLDFNDRTCNYIIITELSDNCKIVEDRQTCYEDNANVSFGYYKIN